MYVLHNQENLSRWVEQQGFERKSNQVAMNQVEERKITADPNGATIVPQPIWSSINEIQASLLKIF